jgi:undecaprenyl-diphosphatase
MVDKKCSLARNVFGIAIRRHPQSRNSGRGEGRDGPLNPFDLKILEFLTQGSSRDSKLYEFVRDCVAGNDVIKGALLVAPLWYLWMQRDPDVARRREIVVASMVGAMLAAAASRAITHLIPFRPRPFSTPGLNLDTPLPQLFEIKGGSFPSDHAALAFGLVTGIFLVWPRVGLALAFYVLAFVGLPRVYLGIHWPTDILGGALLGIACTLILSYPRIRTVLARAPIRWHTRSPAAFSAGMFLVTFGLMTRFQDFRILGGWGVRMGMNVVRAAMTVASLH